LTVNVLRARQEQVDLDQLIPAETADLLYEDQRGERTLAVSSTTLDAAQGLRRRVVTRYARDRDGWSAIDETTFHVDADYFSEVERDVPGAAPTCTEANAAGDRAPERRRRAARLAMVLAGHWRSLDRAAPRARNVLQPTAVGVRTIGCRS
jgi:hypothetical protein